MRQRRAVVALAAVTLVALGSWALSPARANALQPNPLGVGLKPVLGWSSWSSLRSNVSAAIDESEARSMVGSGLTALGYRNVNQDDWWYRCPGPQGPDVSQWGRWVTNSALFPPQGGADGMQVLATYLHGLGLKFGIYVTPGISQQAVAANTPVEGSGGGRLTGLPSGYTARQIATSKVQNNYNCGGMVGLDYRSPGAQLFVDSWADMLASWGVDYVKLDGITNANAADVQAWSRALLKTGRPINLDVTEGHMTLAFAPVLERYATQWEVYNDIECYACEGTGSYPLTAWNDAEDGSGVVTRFQYAAQWQPYAGPGHFNDLDSVEVGNGAGDGLTADARKTVLSLWALAASPLILGTDLTRLDPADLRLLRNTAVLAVDQDGIAASRIVDHGDVQVFSKREPNGDAVVGLFDTGTSDPRTVTVTAAQLGLPAADGYRVTDLWSHRRTRSSGVIGAVVPPEGVALYRIAPME